MKTQYVICIRNDDYEDSLELRKVYKVIPDDEAAEDNLIRIIDESEEDYLYPAYFFVPIAVPANAEQVFMNK
jgi:hypothetical protein